MSWKEVKGFYVADHPTVTQDNEIPLRAKYRSPGSSKRSKSRVDGRHGPRNLKGVPWPVGLRKYPKGA